MHLLNHNSSGRSLSNENLRAQMGASAQSKGGLLSLLEDQLADDGDETVRYVAMYKRVCVLHCTLFVEGK